MGKNRSSQLLPAGVAPGFGQGEGAGGFMVLAPRHVYLPISAQLFLRTDGAGGVVVNNQNNIERVEIVAPIARVWLTWNRFSRYPVGITQADSGVGIARREFVTATNRTAQSFDVSVVDLAGASVDLATNLREFSITINGETERGF